MESKNSQERKPDPIIRIIVLLLLGLMMVTFVLKYDTFNLFLLRLHSPEQFLSRDVWQWTVKFLSYGIQILIDYLILWVLTKTHKLSILMVYISVGSIATGFLLTFITHRLGHTLPVELSSFFVKLVKSQVILVLCIAANIVESVYKPQR